MFKNRSYLLGIGTGIIVGALLLQIMSARPAAVGPGTTFDEMDPLKLKEQASKYYQVFDKETKLFTQADFDAGVKTKLKEETDKLLASKPQAQQQTKIVVYVQPNLDATAVTELLIKTGIISDRKAFTAELEKQGGNFKIQVGPHVFEGVLDMKQVVANLIAVQ
ncbi:hypothetical protein GK047_06020 [Paenibacillus sp. SYP-B3998]|uniref:Endolytic transglycosylase MltG n=1 Tax=Paenibacillus sp. SYP-B3998 TaxID=2678564 RepID=A0A6G3ZTY3_9BACL|nr:hypothetical protein [Paenibacillus sp. SYP-B3998]NEW05575.1 hypothetical protein [Paenibacillus sp. SYP-B3998]